MPGERNTARQPRETLDVSADVLVIGGGPAGAWAALSAAAADARVVLVDKGYLGTSGATAPSNTGTWFVPPGEGRRAAIEGRQGRTGGLADPRWVERTLDTAWDRLHALAACITAGVITGAAAREIKLNRVSSSVSADIDVRGVLGIDPDIRKGFSHVQVEFDIDAECDDEAIDALVAAGTKYSAVFDMLVNPTEVDVIRHR